MFVDRAEHDTNLRVISAQPVTEADWEARYVRSQVSQQNAPTIKAIEHEVDSVNNEGDRADAGAEDAAEGQGAGEGAGPDAGDGEGDEEEAEASEEGEVDEEGEAIPHTLPTRTIVME